MRLAQPGLAHVHRVIPGSGACASAIGNTGVDVVSSPWLIAVLEEASHRVVRDLFEPREASVGVQFALKHVAAAFPGVEIVAYARLTAIHGRRLSFEVRACQGAREVMSGTHERALIDLDRFMSGGAPSPEPASQTGRGAIEFFFDFHSPWCWFASLRIEQLAERTGRRVLWKPMHLARLIERINGRRPLDANPAFVGWFKQDMQDAASRLGLQLRYHPEFPLRPVRALRAAAYAADMGRASSFVQAVMKAYWSEQGDIEDLDCLGAIAQAAGLDPDPLRRAVEDSRFKAIVEANTKEAEERGVFGAPSFICDGKLFWGQDRMDQLESWAYAPSRQ